MLMVMLSCGIESIILIFSKHFFKIENTSKNSDRCGIAVGILMDPRLDRVCKRNVLLPLCLLKEGFGFLVTIDKVGTSSPFESFHVQQIPKRVLIVPNCIHKGCEMCMFILQ